MINDLRYGLRMLMKRPGFTVVAIVTLALGIGANTVIFSGVYAMLIQPLPYRNADRLVIVSQADRQGNEYRVSHPDFSDWKEQSDQFEQMAAFRAISANLSGPGPVERVTGCLVSQDFFPLLGGSPAIGRTFIAEEFRPGGPGSIILSSGFWQRRFGADPHVVGRDVNIDGEEFKVVGVMPPSFEYFFRAAFWTPLAAREKGEVLEDRSAHIYEIIAVLKPGLMADRAEQEGAALARLSDARRAAGQQELRVKVTGLRDSLQGLKRYKMPVIALQLAVLFVLLIASVNLANLLLARTTERRQEFLIRLAMGARRGRLVRQLLSESLLLTLFGSLLGLLLAMWGLDALRAIIPLRIPGVAEVEMNAPVLLTTLAVSALTTLGFSLAPAVLTSRQEVSEGLRGASGSATSDPRRRRLSGALVVTEVALAVVLIVASGLMARTFLNLTKEDPGFNPEHALAVSLSLLPSQYPDYASLVSHFDETIARIEAVPGVESVGGVTYMPLIGYNPGTSFMIEGRDEPPPEMAPRADFQPVTPGYFRAIGMPLLAGRHFSGADVKQTPGTAIINNALAKKFWPGEDPLGKHIQLRGDDHPGSSLSIIGVVGDVKQFGLHSDPRPEIYLPMYRHSMTFIVRTGTNPAALSTAIREAVQSPGDNETAVSLTTMEQVVIDSIEKRRVFVLLLGALSAVALLMAAMGIFGVISYLIAQRTREIGIRMALGAQSGNILKLVIGKGLALTLIGVGAGLAASFALTRFLSSLLFGVSSTDPATFAAIPLLFVVVAVAASYLPARRATRVDPMIALRHD